MVRDAGSKDPDGAEPPQLNLGSPIRASEIERHSREISFDSVGHASRYRSVETMGRTTVSLHSLFSTTFICRWFDTPRLASAWLVWGRSLLAGLSAVLAQAGDGLEWHELSSPGPGNPQAGKPVPRIVCKQAPTSNAPGMVTVSASESRAGWSGLEPALSPWHPDRPS